MKNFRFKALIFTILLVFPLMLITTKAFCGGPNPGVGSDEHLAGPAVVGQIHVIPDPEDPDPKIGSILVDFTGSCKGQPLEFSDIEIETAFDTIQGPDDLEGQRFAGLDPVVDCSPKNGGEEVIIHKVTKFERDNVHSEIKADAIILFVVGK